MIKHLFIPCLWDNWAEEDTAALPHGSTPEFPSLKVISIPYAVCMPEERPATLSCD